MALEEKIAKNPLALSPLLLKNDGLLLPELRALTKVACRFINELAKELGVVRPNAFDRRTCESEILSRHLDELMELGLEQQAASGSSQALTDSVQRLINALALELAELWSSEVERVVSTYALRVEREEPENASRDFYNLKLKRREQAEAAVAQRRSVLLGAGDTSPLVAIFVQAFADPSSRWQGGIALPEAVKKEVEAHAGEFGEFRDDVVAVIDTLRPAASTAHLSPPDRAAKSAHIVDCLVRFLRFEVLQDVLAANLEPVIAAASTSRASDVSYALLELKQAVEAMDPSYSFGPSLCDKVFTPERAKVMGTILCPPAPGRSIAPPSAEAKKRTGS